MLNFILALMLSLAPRRSKDNLMPVADSINQTVTISIPYETATPEQQRIIRQEAMVLIVISFYETGFSPNTRVPFGVSSLARRLRGQPMPVWAQHALRIWRAGRGNCGNRHEIIFGYYHTGMCAPDSYSIRQARTLRNLQRNTRLSFLTNRVNIN